MTKLMKRYEKKSGIELQKILEDELFSGDDFDNFMCGFASFAEEEWMKLQSENAQLKAQLTWRPVSEKPKEGQIVFAMIPTGWVVAQYFNGGFYVDDGFTFGDSIGGVTHWLHIPPAPEGEVK